MESGSAISEIYVIFTPCLKYVSRHADHFYIYKNEHLEKNLYTKTSALEKNVYFLRFNKTDPSYSSLQSGIGKSQSSPY